MAGEVQWSAQNFQDLLPFSTTLTALSNVLPGIKDFLQAEAAAKKVAVELQQDPASLIPDPEYVVIQQILDQINSLLSSIQNEQFNILPLTPQDSGLLGVARSLKTNLLNVRDPHRPTIDANGYTAGFGILMQAGDFGAAQNLFNVIQSAYLTSDVVKIATAVQKLTKNDKYASSTYLNRLAGVASELQALHWASVKLTDFLPGSLQLLNAVSGFLNSLVGHQQQSQVGSFGNFCDAASQTITDTINLIDATIATITAAFPDAAILLFKFPPQVGGTAAVASSVGSWLDPKQHAEIAGVTNTSLLTGMFVMWGGDQASVQALYTLLGSLFLP